MLTMLAGLTAGALHVLAGPDHLAAVAPIAADHPRRGWLSGLQWGVGHSLGVLGIATAALLLRGLLPLDAISGWSERLVGLALVAIGVWGLRQALLRRWHVHTHLHEGVTHAHLHYHGAQTDHARPAAHVHGHLSVAMGALHGLAGSAHVLGVLPAVALPTLAGSLAYLGAFGAGAIASMTVYGWLIGRLMGRTGPRPFRWLLTGASSAAIAIGAVWLVW